jgi:hypothetical protein
MADEKGKKTSTLVPMIGPDGSSALMDADRVHELMMQGAVPGVVMRSPDGQVGVVRFEDAEAALKSGGALMQNDGSPYPEGEEPMIVGHNANGQPVFGSRTGKQIEQETLPDVKGRALRAALGVVGGAAKGLFDASPTEQEKAEGLTTPFDFMMRPFERIAEGQAQEGEQAASLLQRGEYARGLAHGIASILPMVGPWTAEAVEDYYQRLGRGDVSGAIGALGGNAAVAAAMEAAPKIVAAGAEMVKTAPARVAEMIAPEAKLDKPAGTEQLSPRERWEAANRAGVDLDLAQATDTGIPKLVKKVNEASLGDMGSYEDAGAARIAALRQHASDLVRGVPDASGAPLGDAMGREDFGAAAQRALKQHRDQISDAEGTQIALDNLLSKADPRSMTKEEFGDAAREALEKHRQGMLDQERGIYEGLDNRIGDQGPNMDLVRQKARGIYEKNRRFYDNHPEALKGGDARVWAWVKDLAGVDKEKVPSALSGDAAKAPTKNPSGVVSPPDTWADLQTARSHLLDLTRGPEFVGDLATGWAKQLTGAIDETMTSADKTPGLSAKDVQEFRQANAIHKRVKELYDSPQSPFYWLARDEGAKVGDRLGNLSPQTARDFREAMGAVDRSDLVGQQHRQAILDLVDPARNGQPDFAGFPKRWQKFDKEQASETFATRPELMNGLDALSQRATKKTPYDDMPGLRAVIDAPDAAAASNALFDSQGRNRLSGEEVAQFGQAAPELVPHLQQQAVARILDPANNGTPDLGGFPNRWNKSNKDMAAHVLTPDQLQQFDEYSAVSRAAQAKDNPSGTASKVVPAAEVVNALHNPLSGAVEFGAQYLAARAMNNPAVVKSIMEHEAPPTVAQTVAEAARTPGVISRAIPVTPAEAASAAVEHPATAVAAGAAAAGAGQSMRDQFAQMTKRRNAVGGAEGVSTPPNEGQVTSVATAEPNDVHDAAKEAAEMQAEDQHGQGTVSGPPAAAGAPGGNQKPGGAMIQTGASSSGKLGIADGAPSPQSKVEAPQGATHEVLGPNGETLGHIVDGEYLPLQAATA